MGGRKIAEDMARADLPGFLRQLADALEGRGAGGLRGLERARRLELLAEAEGGRARVELKAKDIAEAPPERKDADVARERRDGAAAREKYRQLKKAMQADYKAMQAAARLGELPPSDRAESFLSLAEIMAEDASPVAEPGAKAELARANAAFFEDCRALGRALAARDANAAAGVLERLERRKAACHAQFK